MGFVFNVNTYYVPVFVPKALRHVLQALYDCRFWVLVIVPEWWDVCR